MKVNSPNRKASSNISFDEKSRVFALNLSRSYYAFRVREDGALIHLRSGVSPVGGQSFASLEKIESYEDPAYPWETQGAAYEFPAFGDITYHDCAVKLSFPEASGEIGKGEAANLPVRDFRPRYQSHKVMLDASPGYAAAHGQATAKRRARETLLVCLKDESYAFELLLYYRITPEHDIIERWVELRNHSRMEVDVESLAFGTLNLPTGSYEVQRPSGNWCREFSMVKHLLPPHKVVVDQKGLNTGHGANPFFLINEEGMASEDSGELWFGALAYSGNWQMVFEHLGVGPLRVHGGYEQSDFRIRLSPGEKHATPAFVIGISNQGREGASRRLHDFIKEYILPSPKGDTVRPVLYNSWEGTYFDVSFENQLKLARIAASIGVELFCIDDGWFGTRTNDKSGLGDWIPRKDAFPDGLKPVSDEVHALGMQFGIWLEPEMVNPDSELYRAHPDWVLHYPGRPRTLFRNQLILDLGREEVFQYLKGALHKLVSENGIDFIKWDMNRYAIEAGSVVGQALWQRHVAALYRLMDGLRAEFPGLSIQSCSGGGGRIDIGVLARSDQVWTSDNTDAIDRVSIQEGFSYAYPSRVMECWVTHENNHQAGRYVPLDFRFDVAMRGILGIGTCLDSLPEETLKVYQRKISFYKRIRVVVQQGDLYRLRLLERDKWSVWLYVSKDCSKAVYSVVVPGQPAGINFAAPRLKGLLPDSVYRITDELGKEHGSFTGIQLMNFGIPGDACFGGFEHSQRSRTLLIEEY